MCFNIIFVMSEGTKIQITCKYSVAQLNELQRNETDTKADAAAVEAASVAIFVRAAVEAD